MVTGDEMRDAVFFRNASDRAERQGPSGPDGHAYRYAVCAHEVETVGSPEETVKAASRTEILLQCPRRGIP